MKVKLFKYELSPLLVLLSTFPFARGEARLLLHIICLSKWKSGAGETFSFPPLPMPGVTVFACCCLEWDGVPELVTEVTVSPGSEGEAALKVYRILPFLRPQRVGPPRPAGARVFDLHRRPSHVDWEMVIPWGKGSSPWCVELDGAAGVYLGGELLFKIRLCFWKMRQLGLHLVEKDILLNFQNGVLFSIYTYFMENCKKMRL